MYWRRIHAGQSDRVCQVRSNVPRTWRSYYSLQKAQTILQERSIEGRTSPYLASQTCLPVSSTLHMPYDALHTLLKALANRHRWQNW